MDFRALTMTESPANIPRPMGSTDRFLPGKLVLRAAAAAGVCVPDAEVLTVDDAFTSLATVPVAVVVALALLEVPED